MKSTLTIACLILTLFVTTGALHAQKSGDKVPLQDSLAITGVWKQFIASIDAKQYDNIRGLSLAHVQCVLCPAPLGTTDYIVPVDSLLTWTKKIRAESTLWRSMTQADINPVFAVRENYQPRNVNFSEGKDLVLYELQFTAIYPSNFEPATEGAYIIFQLVKTKDGFKLYGVYSVRR